MRDLRKRIPTAAMTAFMLLASVPVSSMAEFNVSIDIGIPTPPLVAIAPPALPVYEVPSPPDEGYVWAPGYWHWGLFGYYWVPGTWVMPPQPAVLWTPGYWGWSNDSYAWHEGYWSPHVGYYGGINYGGGYGGSGFNGGRWDHNTYIVNRSVTNVTNITNVTNVTNNYNRASFNGGPGGTTATPTARDRKFMNERHIQPTSAQVNHIKSAGNDPQFRASANGGKPPVAATAKPGVFNGRGVVAAKQAGPKNILAEQHNQSVMQNPSLAHGATLPKTEHGGQQNGQQGQGHGAENHQTNPSNPYPAYGHNKPMDVVGRQRDPQPQHEQQQENYQQRQQPEQQHQQEQQRQQQEQQQQHQQEQQRQQQVQQQQQRQQQVQQHQQEQQRQQQVQQPHPTEHPPEGHGPDDHKDQGQH